MSAVAIRAAGNRDQIILDHLPQVKMTAAKFHRRCPPDVLLEDLISAGVVGLLEAYGRFDARRNLRFKTFAEYRIRGAIVDYLRQLDPLPRDIRRFQKERDAVIWAVSQRHKRQASEHEIADELGMTIGRYRKFAAIAQTATVSLDDQCGERPAGDVPDSASLSRADCAAPRCALEAAIQDLPTSERFVVTAIRNGHSHRTIATRLRVSECRVSQIKHSAVEHLRATLGH